MTVGFISVMILSVGQRILPAFAGMRMLWSTKLMFAGLAFVILGCTLCVSCEIIAYQGYAAWAWTILPIPELLRACGIHNLSLFKLSTFSVRSSFSPATHKCALFRR